MNTDYSQKFLSEQQIHYKALKALIQKKHEIRINFSKSKTFQLLQNEVSHQYNHLVESQKSDILRNKQYKTIQPLRHNRSSSLDQNQPIQYTKEKSLIEVIKRQRNKFGLIGAYQQKPIIRTSHMSRSYRKNRNKSRFSKPLKILQLQEKLSKKKQNGLIDANNKSKLSAVNISNENITEQNPVLEQVDAIITLPCMNQHENTGVLKRINLTITPNIFSIRNNIIFDKIQKRFHYQSHLCNEILSQQRKNHNKNSSLKSKANSFSLSNQNIPFLLQTKPSYFTERKKFPERFISVNRSRFTSIVNKQQVTKQQSCRPWTSFRNGDEKIEAKIIQQ